jgi:hypothetical protein
MLLYSFIAFVIAKLKGYHLTPILKAYSLYPFALAELFYLFLQLNIILRNYTYIQYTALINSVYLYTLILPMLAYRLYKPGIIGSLFIISGTFLNKFVMSQNAGKMPVFATLSKLTGYYDAAAIHTVDSIHIVGNAGTNFKILSDYIDLGFSILSIGDLLIHSFTTIIVYYVIKEINVNPKYKKKKEKEFLYGII